MKPWRQPRFPAPESWPLRRVRLLALTHNPDLDALDRAAIAEALRRIDGAESTAPTVRDLLALGRFLAGAALLSAWERVVGADGTEERVGAAIEGRKVPGVGRGAAPRNGWWV